MLETFIKITEIQIWLHSGKSVRYFTWTLRIHCCLGHKI